jgi:hypothetical protein
MNRIDANRLAHALRHELWTTSSDDLLARLADRGGITVGLNPPDETDDDELAQVVWRALLAIGLAEGD